MRMLIKCVIDITQSSKTGIYVQPKWLTEPKFMSLSWSGPHIQWLTFIL